MVPRLKNRVERLFNTRGVHRKGALFHLYSGLVFGVGTEKAFEWIPHETCYREQQANDQRYNCSDDAHASSGTNISPGGRKQHQSSNRGDDSQEIPVSAISICIKRLEFNYQVQQLAKSWC